MYKSDLTTGGKMELQMKGQKERLYLFGKDAQKIQSVFKKRGHDKTPIVKMQN